MRNFEVLKKDISNMRALPYFGVNVETIFQADASKNGLGTALMQGDKVISFASWTLTKPKQNYQNVGTILGMEKFHYFLYGKEFILETDQKSLVSIYKKHMIDISPRVQRLKVKGFPYQPFRVVYKKGKLIPVADALSRFTPVDPEDHINFPIIAIHMIMAHILMSTDTSKSSTRLDQRVHTN